MARPWPALPFIFGNRNSGSLDQIDTNFAQFLTDFNNSEVGYNNSGTDAGVVNAYSVTIPSLLAAYAAGLGVSFVPLVSNTGASTLSVNGLSTAPIIRSDGSMLTGGELVANYLVFVVFDGSNFRIKESGVVGYFNAAVANPIAIECAGARFIEAHITITRSAGFSITLNHLGNGAVVQVSAGNNTSPPQNHFIPFAAFTPSGTPYSATLGIQSGSANGGAFVNMNSGAAPTLVFGNAFTFRGIANLTAGNLILSW